MYAKEQVMPPAQIFLTEKSSSKFKDTSIKPLSASKSAPSDVRQTETHINEIIIHKEPKAISSIFFLPNFKIVYIQTMLTSWMMPWISENIWHILTFCWSWIILHGPCFEIHWAWLKKILSFTSKSRAQISMYAATGKSRIDSDASHFRSL